jgi:hypothetical protein
MCVYCNHSEGCDCMGGASLSMCSCAAGDHCPVCNHDPDANVASNRYDQAETLSPDELIVGLE